MCRRLERSVNTRDPTSLMYIDGLRILFLKKVFVLEESFTLFVEVLVRIENLHCPGISKEKTKNICVIRKERVRGLTVQFTVSSFDCTLLKEDGFGYEEFRKYLPLVCYNVFDVQYF